jgi:integrase
MGTKIRLTDAIVRRLPLPVKGKAITLDDGGVTGFGARVTAAGARSYVLRYTTRAGRERTFTIGDAAVWRCTSARDKARDLRREIEDGADPLGEIEEGRAAPTVADLIDRFRDEHLPRKRPSTADAYDRILRLHIGPHFGPHTKVADVRFEDVDALHRKITKTGATYVANRVIAVLSKMFALAIRWRWCEANPVRGVEKNNEHHRRRYLSGDELARLLAALADYSDRQVADAIRILLLTGARRGEVLSLRWADLDLDLGVWSKPAASTKQGKAHRVPLSAAAMEVLRRQPRRSEFVFSSHGATGHLVEVKKAWRWITRAADIADLRLHDLRHSFASALVSSGASLPLIGALLGHSQPATTARYAHLHDDPMRLAAEQIGDAIAAAGKAVPK